MSTISDKNYGKNCYLDNFLFFPLPHLNNVEKLCYGFLILSMGWGGRRDGAAGGEELKTFLKFP